MLFVSGGGHIKVWQQKGNEAVVWSGCCDFLGDFFLVVFWADGRQVHTHIHIHPGGRVDGIEGLRH